MADGSQFENCEIAISSLYQYLLADVEVFVVFG